MPWGRKVKVNSPVRARGAELQLRGVHRRGGQGQLGQSGASHARRSRAGARSFRPLCRCDSQPASQCQTSVIQDDGTFSAEKVIALKPDVLFIVQSGPTSRCKPHVIEAAGIPIVVIDYNAQLLERHLSSTRAIGKVMGTEARAEEPAACTSASTTTLARIAKSTGQVAQKSMSSWARPGPTPWATATAGNKGARC